MLDTQVFPSSSTTPGMSWLFERSLPLASLIDVVDHYFPDARAHWPQPESTGDAMRFLNARLPGLVGVWADGPDRVRVGIDPSMAVHEDTSVLVNTLETHRRALEQVFGPLGGVSWSTLASSLNDVVPTVQRWVVLIDAENILTGNWPYVQQALQALGEVVAIEAFADFAHLSMLGWKKLVVDQGIKAIHAPRLCSQKSNSDMSLTIRAMDWIHAGKVDGMVLVSGDSDFGALALRVREAGLRVHGMGNVTSRATYMRLFHHFTVLDGPINEPSPVNPAREDAVARTVTRLNVHPEAITREDVNALPVSALPNLTLPRLMSGCMSPVVHQVYVARIVHHACAQNGVDLTDWVPLIHLGTWLTFGLSKALGINKLSTLFKGMPAFELGTFEASSAVRWRGGRRPVWLSDPADPSPDATPFRGAKSPLVHSDPINEAVTVEKMSAMELPSSQGLIKNDLDPQPSAIESLSMLRPDAERASVLTTSIALDLTAFRNITVPRVSASRGWLPVHQAYIEQILSTFFALHPARDDEGWIRMASFGSWLRTTLPSFSAKYFCAVKVSEVFKRATNAEFSWNDEPTPQLRVRPSVGAATHPMNVDGEGEPVLNSMLGLKRAA